MPVTRPMRLPPLARVLLSAGLSAGLCVGLCSAGLLGCNLPTAGGTDPRPPGSRVGQDPGTDRDDYLALQHQLELGRRQVLDRGAQELSSQGGRLYWKTDPGAAAKLHGRSGERTIDYGFSIGNGDRANFRASQGLLVTAQPDGGQVRYLAYDPRDPDTRLGTLTLPAPSDEQRWWAYAVAGNALYVITTGEQTSVLRWHPGDEQAETLTTLESAGATIGELWDFDLEGDVLVLVESGRLWKLSLTENRASFLGNDTQIAGAVAFDGRGVTFEDSIGLRRFDYAAGTVRDLSAEIAASAYRINDTYAAADHYYSATTGANFSSYGDWVVYTANDGIFAYDLVRRSVAPVLLSPLDLDGRLDYRYPVALDDGTLYTVGLQSSSSSVGADGPVYQVSLAGMLK
jgi:hypothetical protein